MTVTFAALSAVESVAVSMDVAFTATVSDPVAGSPRLEVFREAFKDVFRGTSGELFSEVLREMFRGTFSDAFRETFGGVTTE